MPTAFLKYGTGSQKASVELITRGGIDYKSNPTLASGDVKVSKDGGTLANITTLPTVTPSSSIRVEIAPSSTELECKELFIQFIDQTSPKEWEDQTIRIYTYGHASAYIVDDWSTAKLTAAAVNAEVDTALADINLDHLVKSAVDTNFATTVHLDSIIGHIADAGGTATFDRLTDSLEASSDDVQEKAEFALFTYRLDQLLVNDADLFGSSLPTEGSVVHALMSKTASGFTYDQTTDSLQAIRDRGDAAWTGGGGSVTDRKVLQETTIATLASQTSFTLTAGSADNSAYRGCVIVVEDASTAVQKCVGVIDAYTGSTKTVTLLADPGVFTMAVGDNVYILADASVKPTTAADFHLDITSGGGAGINWGNVENPTTSVGLSGTTTAWNAAWDAEVQSEVQDAIEVNNLDHLLKVAAVVGDVTTNSIIGRLADDSGDFSGFNSANYSLQAIRDAIDTVGGIADLILVDTTEIGVAGAGLTAIPWNSAWSAFADRLLMNETTIATLASQTSFTLTAGSADNDAYNGCLIVVKDASTAAQKCYGVIDDYVGSSRTVTLLNNPSVFTMAVGDSVYILADASLKPTGVQDYHVDVTSGGNVGVDWANLESPTTTVNLSGTSVKTATDVETDTQNIQTRLPTSLVSGRMDSSVGAMAANTLTASALATDAVTEIQSGLATSTQLGTNGNALSAIPWNAAWDAEVQSEVQDAIEVNNLDHLLKVAAVTGDVTTNSIIGRLADDSGDFAGFSSVNHSLQALRDAIDVVGGIADLILVDTTEIGVAGAGLTAIPWNASWDAEVQSEVDDALKALNLDHLLAASVSGTDVVDNSVIAKMVSKSGTADWDTFDNTSDSLEALADGGGGPSTAAIADAVWDEVLSGHLTAGSTGEALNAAGSAGDPWTTTLPGAYTGSQAGKMLADILTDTGTTLQGELDGIQADTEDIQSRLPAALVNSRMASYVGEMGSGVVTAAAVATDAIDADALATSAVNEIAAAVTADSPTLLFDTTIASVTDNTTFTLTDGAGVIGGLVGCWLLIRNNANPLILNIRRCISYPSASTKTVVLDAATSFNLSVTDTVQVFANYTAPDMTYVLQAMGLDHLVSAAVIGADVTDGSIIAKMVSKSGPADWDSFNNTTDSLEALSDATPASNPPVLADTTIATVTSQTQFTLTTGPTNSSALRYATILIIKTSDPTKVGYGRCITYTGSTKTVMLDSAVAAGTFTVEVGDRVVAIAAYDYENTLAAQRVHNLDHLMSTSAALTDVADNSIIARITSATADFDTFSSATDSLEALRDYFASTVAPNVVSSGGLSGSGTLSYLVETIRQMADEPTTNAKYTNADILKYLRGAVSLVLSDVNVNADSPILVRYPVSIEVDKTIYTLPPTAQKVYSLAKFNNEYGTMDWEVLPDNQWGWVGDGYVLEGNSIRLTRKWKTTESMIVSYVPNAEALMHKGTSATFTSSTITLDSSVDDGELDTRPNIYAGYLVRILSSSDGAAVYTQDRIITGYNNQTRVATVSEAFNPALVGIVTYEVVPQYSNLMLDLWALKTAIRLASIEGNQERVKLLEMEYLKAQRSLRLTLTKEHRIGSRFDGRTGQNPLVSMPWGGRVLGV